MTSFAKFAIACGLVCFSTIALSQDYGSMYSNNKNFEEIEKFDDSVATALHSINSFPAYIDHGEHSAQASLKGGIPKTNSVKGNIRGCNFAIYTSKYSISTFSLDASKEFNVEQSTLIPGTLVKTSERNGAALLGVSTDLQLGISTNHLASCKKAIQSSKKIYIGTYSLAFSKLTFGKSSKKKRAARVRHAPRTKLFLKWEKRTNRIVLLDENNFPPLATSAIFAAIPKKEGLFEINFQPKSSITFTESQISKTEPKDVVHMFAH